MALATHISIGIGRLFGVWYVSNFDYIEYTLLNLWIERKKRRVYAFAMINVVISVWLISLFGKIKRRDTFWWMKYKAEMQFNLIRG